MPSLVILLVCIIAFMIVGSAFVGLLVGFLNNANRLFLEPLADANNGRVGRFRNRKAAFFNRRGIAFRASIIRLKGKNFLQVAALIETGDFRMKVFEELLNAELKRFLGMQDIQIGWPSFDQRYIIQANSADELRQYLTQEVQDLILRLGHKIEIKILRGQFTCQVNVDGFSSQKIDVKLEQCLAVYFAMLAATRPPTTPVVIDMRQVESEQVTCMVCGESIDADRVDCRTCKTPHHHECWTYLGMCSTYACGQRKYRIFQPSKAKSGRFRIGH